MIQYCECEEHTFDKQKRNAENTTHAHQTQIISGVSDIHSGVPGCDEPVSFQVTSSLWRTSIFRTIR